ncbi:MAG TPA: peptidylprolyl isomerase [Candidatus Limnocylindria bacterium]|jgi:parvulin-like peptidyl-prolyl isomerase|nr:peptidylprolyl isomerase [Candidatus Limnocylindria bacterium]
MARRIPLPRLTRRQRTARWQRERRQQAIIVTVFSAALFFVVGLITWAASDRYYQENLKAAMRFDGQAVPMRDWRNEVNYQLLRFYVEYGVPAGYENDPQIAQQKASYERAALDSLVQYTVLDAQARADGVTVSPDAISARYADDWSQFRSRHVLITINKEAPDQTLELSNALAKAVAIRDELRADPNNQALWNQVAKDNSNDPGTADKGGELGWVGKGQFVKEFEDGARALAIGQVSDPVKSDFGYHVIQVEERRGPEFHDVVKRWLASGFTEGDITAHVRYDLLREEFTKRLQEQGIASPTAQIHLAQIQVATPRPVAGDFQAFGDQIKKVSDINTALEAGTDFAEVAKKYSEDSATAEKGGDLGWIAHGMIVELTPSKRDLVENELFALAAGARSSQYNQLITTTWYKVIEKSDSRELDDDQKKKVKDNAFQYWLNQQKKAHDVLRLVPGLEFD